LNIDQGIMNNENELELKLELEKRSKTPSLEGR
jgi:hypothetical protein